MTIERKLTWVRQTGRFQNGENLFLGRWKAGSVYYDGFVTKGDNRVHKVTCNLSGIKDVLGNYADVNEAKARLEKVVDMWLGKINAEPKEFENRG